MWRSTGPGPAETPTESVTKEGKGEKSPNYSLSTTALETINLQIKLFSFPPLFVNFQTEQKESFRAKNDSS